MNRERRFGRKRSSQGHGKKMRLKYIAILPSFITLMNAMCGFLAIVYASRGTSSPGIEELIFQRPGFTLFALSGYMIFVAMVADVLDGRVARLSKTTSSFGGQLDSLSDAISFGVAPAFLMLKLVGAHLQNLKYASPGLAVVIGRAVFLIAILYVLCAVIRLARFNVENEEDESAHMNFSGLPSPAAAGAIVSLVIFQQDLLPKIADRSDALFRMVESGTVWALPVVTLCTGLLMVTRIRYPHVVNHYLRGKKRFSTFVGISAAALLMLLNIQFAMVIGFCGFAVSGFSRWIAGGIFFRKKHKAESVPEVEAEAEREKPKTE